MTRTPTFRLAPGLPGIELPGRGEGPRPRNLLGPGCLLLAAVDPGERHGIARHRRHWGDLPPLDLAALVEASERESLVGGGGAAFPTARKLASMSDRRVAYVVVNGAEGESASGKDGVLLAHVPHLVLDGAAAAAQALGVRRIVVRVSGDRRDLIAALPDVLAERPEKGLRFELSVGPATFVAGEATAVVRALAGGPAAPAELGRPPMVPRRLPGRRSAVLLSNVEAFARLAVAARGWPADSALASASGGVRSPGVVELPRDATLRDLANAAGGVVDDPAALVTGGWHGRWLAWPHTSAHVALSRSALAEVGGRWGAGAFVWIPGSVPLVDALAGVAAELAAGTAGQCGPCWRGLPEVAVTAVAVAAGTRPRAELDALLSEVEGRGLCAHPTAAAEAIRSAVRLIESVA